MLAETIGPDRALSLTYIPNHSRRALRTLYAIDAAMGDVLRTTSEPMVGAIRLAWWRERLEELGQGGETPAEPRLQAAMSDLLPRGIFGNDIAGLEAGWLKMLAPFPWDVALAEAIRFRGQLLFGLGARILGGADAAVEDAAVENAAVEDAGGVWALVDAARQCSDAKARANLIELARTAARDLAGHRFTPRLRPLSMLGALAVRDLDRWPAIEPEGTPARALAMLAHRLSGRLRAPG